ncbi:MAG TPA: RluA family pseudouridine synthase [Treponemataceae bacterium]|nr:RluA family pseudouridine synthase [Treponemataceae bacterium]
MNYIEITAQKDDDGRRIDAVIRKAMPSMPLSLLYKNIRTGFIKLNGKKTQTNTRILNGDCICIAEVLYASYKQESTERLPVQNADFITLFKNEHMWIINKPAGITVQKAAKDSISLDQIIKASSDLPMSLSFTPGPLHRLDRNTSGIVCFSQSLKGARWFTEQMKGGGIGKFYLGLAQGLLEHEEEWEDGIEKIEGKQKFHTVKIVEGSARTRAKPLSQGNLFNKDVTLIEYQIFGGKTHQIRAQSSFHGHPLIGDSAYGGDCTLVPSFFLHANILLFPGNDLGIPLRIRSPLPQNFKNTLEICLPKHDTALIL